MEVTITTVSGPTGKSEYRFRAFPVMIGRKPDNHISISDPAVSRYHCQIVRVGGSLRIIDLGSQNGIRVNERAVQQQDLADGDLLSIGAARLRVQTAASTGVNSAAREGETTKIDDAFEGMDTTWLDPADSAYLRRTPLRGAGRSERDLWTLLDLCRAVGERATAEEAQIQLIERLFEAVPAERGAIALCEEPGAPPVSLLTRSRLRGTDEFEVSRGVLRQVLQESRAFLRTRIQDEQDDAPRTMVADQVQAALAVPLMVGGRTIGVLYLDSRQPDALFDRAHLDLATAAAATAAAAIESLRRQHLLQARARLLEARSEPGADLLLLGGSSEADALRGEAEARAAGDDPILLCGPAGSEGARLAHWIHLNSARSDGPFVRVRCDASSPDTLHKELFGDDQARPGMRQLALFEAAFGGTVLIQGIGSIPSECEPRLVRLLRAGTLERRAGAEEVPVDVRVILLWEGDRDEATLEAGLGSELMELMGAPLEIPAIDDRPADIPDIAQRIAGLAAHESGRPGGGLSPGVAALLKRFSWPSNITGLRATVERAEAARTGERIEVDDLPEEILESGQAKIGGYHQGVYDARKRILLDALERTGGNVTEAAALLEIQRTYLYRLIRTLDMKDEISGRFD